MVWVLSLPQRLGYLIFPEQILAAILALATALVFIDSISPDDSPHRKSLSGIFAMLALIVGLYLAVRIPVLSEEAFFRPGETLLVSIVVIPLVLEGLRRSVGWSLLIVFAAFATYGVFGDLIPGKMQARASSPADLLRFLGTDTTAMLGLPLSVTCLVVVMFILFGRILQTTGGTAFFTGLSQALAGRGPGSPAKVAIVASSLFGSISGSAVSNVMSTGVITIPMMKRSGVPAYRAGAIESVASTGGQLMPPVMGAAAFLMAEFLQVPYKEILIAALVPAILYYLALFLQVDFLARRAISTDIQFAEVNRTNINDEPNDSQADILEQAPSVASVLKSGWLLPVPFAVLIIALFSFNLSPELSVFYSLVVLITLSFLRKDKDQWMTPRRIISDLAATGRSVASLILVTAIAGMIIGVLSNTGLSFSLGFVLLSFGKSSLFGLLLLTALVCIVLGMGLPTTGVYLLLATLAAPPLIDLGLVPIQAHLFVLYFGMLSMITPPVALAAFAAAGLADAPQMRTGFEAMRLGWCAYLVPFLFVYHPQLLLRGDVISIVTTLVSVLVALLMISASLAGYARAPLSIATRALLIGTAIPLLIPLPEQLQWLQFVALLGAMCLLATHYMQTRDKPLPTG